MKQLGRYTLEKRIAVGGMAEVWLARAGEVVVAVKRAASTADRDLFLEEVRVASRLTHPNIAQVYEAGETDDLPWLAMEYVEGLPWKGLRGLPHGLTVYVTAKVARALDYAHHLRDASGKSLEVMHRDVSPANVLVSVEGEVKLIDFGIARASQVPFVGRPRYFCPEAVEAEPLTPKSDQFALGVVAWEQLTGRRLFSGDSDLAILEAVRQCVIPPTGVRPDVDAVVRRALAKDAADRWPDCGAFAQALEDLLLELDGPTRQADLAAAVRAAIAAAGSTPPR